MEIVTFHPVDPVDPVKDCCSSSHLLCVLCVSIERGERVANLPGRHMAERTRT
jgi:hypothetical protein